MSSSGNPLGNASNDANQNMSPAPAGSPASPCGAADSPDSPSNQVIDPTKSHWISIRLVDPHGKPVPGEDYKVILPDGITNVEGSLDAHGRARISGIDSGNCKISFPNRDAKDWEKLT